MAVEIQLAGKSGDDGVTDALSVFMNLYESGDDKELLDEFTSDLPIEVLMSYTAFLRALRESCDNVKLAWVSPLEIHGTKSQMTRDQMCNAITALEEIINDRYINT